MLQLEKEKFVLNDLLNIQCERILVYERLSNHPDFDHSICDFLKKIVVQSKNSLIDLRRHLDISLGDPAAKLRVNGDIYNNWREELSTVNTAEVINYCDKTEQATINAYMNALGPGNKLSREAKGVIATHLNMIKRIAGFISECKQRPTTPEQVHEMGFPFVSSRENNLSFHLS